MNNITTILSRLGIDGNRPLVHWLVIIVGFILVFYVSRLFCNKVFIPIVQKLTKKTQGVWDDILFNSAVLKNFCDLIPPIILAQLIPVIENHETLTYSIGLKVCWVYITVVTTRLLCSVFSSLYLLSNEHEKLKNHTLLGVFQMLKIVVICVGIIIIISVLIDKDPANILAGLGASAAVLMLVFKDSIMGLVAGVQLSANDMLRPGDWITIPKHGADGVVTEVTLTTVKVQNWDKTITTIPPYSLVSDSFQNWRSMHCSGGRRVKRSIFIDMNTVAFCTDEQIKKFRANGWMNEKKTDDDCSQPVNLQIFREYLEEYLRKHPKVNDKMMIMVRQLQPTPQGLPLELYFFSDGTNWVFYEHMQAEIFEYVFAMLPQFGLRAFQSPAGTDFTTVGLKEQ